MGKGIDGNDEEMLRFSGDLYSGGSLTFVCFW